MIIYPNDKWILNRAGNELDGLEVKGTYFINYALFNENNPRPWGGFFTHKENELFDDIAKKVDYAVCMNENVKEYLTSLGVKRVEVIRNGYDPRIKKEPVFGWCGRKYKSGRKGEELLDKIGVEYGNYDNAPEFYKKIDYLVVTSRNEGGPIPVIDAIAAGVPVIARKGIGWCDEFPCIRYESDEELLTIISQLRNPPTWEGWRAGHKLLFDLI